MKNSSYLKTKKRNAGESSFKIIGELFTPVIPGIIAAGLCSGFSSLIAALVADYEQYTFWLVAHQLLNLIGISFMSFMPAWIGYSASERFGGTAILGGMLGMITGLDGINTIAQALNLYSAEDPLNSILSSGRGGIVAAIFGAWLLSKIESILHRHMPKSIDMVCTPFFSICFVIIPYVLLIMPLTGLLSTGLSSSLESVCMSENIVIRAVTGFVCASLFLIAVMFGMQYAFVALYSVQLETIGYITLFPTLAMAGAGQVGAGLALLFLARKNGNSRFANIIGASIIPGMMGVGTPLLYGVTLPLGKPFFTAGIAGGIGGAFIMLMEVASTGYGASGLLGLPMMTAGPKGALHGILFYLLGLGISCFFGFIFTFLFYRNDNPDLPD